MFAGGHFCMSVDTLPFICHYCHCRAVALLPLLPLRRSRLVTLVTIFLSLLSLPRSGLSASYANSKLNTQNS